jgi:DNA-binding transcriptional regulator GbsR (MarR family)
MLTEKQTELIEKIGIHFETSFPPAAARIFALLIVSDQEAYGFDEIREELRLSKSATSNGINFLLSVKKIEYFTKSGDRKRYFRWSPKNTISHFKEGIEQVLGLSSLLEETLKNKTQHDSGNYHQLADLTDLMKFLRQEMPGVFARWENSRPTKPN